MHLTPIGVWLLILAMMLINRLIRDLLPQMKKDPIIADNDDLCHKALEAFQRKKMMRAKILKKSYYFTGAKVVVQLEDGRLWIQGLIVESINDDYTVCSIQYG